MAIRDSDEDLLARVKRGDGKAVAQVYDAHHAAVRAFATRLVGEESVAEDLVHEVFVALPRALRRYRGDSALRTFLIGIAVNKSKHYIRAAARRRAAHTRYRERVVDAAPDNAEDMVQRRELAMVLTRALDTLPPKQRAAFVLCDVEERSSDEVAEIVGAPPATVRTRLFHARRKLRVFLEKEGVR